MRYISRLINISFIVMIIFSSLFISINVLSPKSTIVKAIDPLVQYDSIVTLEFADSSALNTPIHPLRGVRNVDIKVTYLNTVPDYFRKPPGRYLLFGFFKFVFLAPVHIKIENIPDWCTASVAPPDLIFDAFGEGEELVKQVTLQIAVNKQSTALFPHTLRIVANGDPPDKHIKSPPEVTLPVAITPGYVPLISTDPGSTIKKTTPGEPVDWNIKISNNGNGEAIVRSRIIEQPDDWVITINPQIIVPSLADADINEKIMSLTALPPVAFGYYNEPVSLQIELTPEFSSPGGTDDNSTKGSPIYLTLAIQLRGFSMPGFELIILICGILILIMVRKYKIFKNM